MTSNHFRHGKKHLDKTVFALCGVTADANTGEDCQAKAHRSSVHDRSIAFDRSGFFQKFDPSGAGRGRQANLIGQYVVRQSGIGLKFAQNLQVDRIEPF